MKDISENGQKHRMGQEHDRTKISCTLANLFRKVLQKGDWDNAKVEKLDGLDNAERNKE